jgi:DNA-binding protein HU-beta
MNQAELKAAMATECGGSRVKAVESALNALGEVVLRHLAADGADADAEVSVDIPHLGKLVVKTRAARMGRNPATGKAIEIPEKRVIDFRPCKALRDAVAGEG